MQARGTATPLARKEDNLHSQTETITANGTLLLTRRDVEDLLELDECITAVEEAHRAHAEGRSIPPGVLGAHVEGGGFHLKTAGLLGTRPYFAAKLNANFHSNAERFGLPRIQGLVVLSDGRHGYPLAVMDSTELTAVRTAAATAVATKYLALAEATTATLIGSGLQARAQLAALCRVRPIDTVFAFDLEPSTAESFAADLSEQLDIEVRAVQEIQSASRRSQIVVTCTPSRGPLLGPEDISRGTFVAAVGADSEEKQELDPELLANATLVVDHLEQCATIGELHHALEAGVLTKRDVHAELHEVVAGSRPGRTSPEEVTVFDSTGVALQDVAAAALAYERACERGVGTRMTLL